MKFIEQPRLALFRIAGKGATRQTAQCIVGNMFSTGQQCHQPVPRRNSPQILIGHWNRMAERVEQNRIRRLLAHTRQIASSRLRSDAVGAAASFLSEPPNSSSSIATNAFSAGALRV